MKDEGHIEEFKIRLRPDDADLVRALARKLDVPPAVLMRRWVVASVGSAVPMLATGADNRRPA